MLTQLIFVKMCAKLEFLKKVRESHVDINTHTVIIPLLSILYKTFIVEEVGFCRLNLFTEVAATVRVITFLIYIGMFRSMYVYNQQRL